MLVHQAVYISLWWASFLNTANTNSLMTIKYAILLVVLPLNIQPNLTRTIVNRIDFDIERCCNKCHISWNIYLCGRVGLRPIQRNIQGGKAAWEIGHCCLICTSVHHRNGQCWHHENNHNEQGGDAPHVITRDFAENGRPSSAFSHTGARVFGYCRYM